MYLSYKHTDQPVYNWVSLFLVIYSLPMLYFSMEIAQ